MNTLRQPLLREITAVLLMAVLLLQSATAVAPGPAWWGRQSVADPYAIPDDFAVANTGQLKYLATKAAAAMNAELPGGAGGTINAMVAAWNATPTAGVTRDNYLAINQGQLKQVAAPFYNRLSVAYPWAGSSGVRDDYLLVNLGQLKQVFSFELKFRTVGQGPVQIPAITLAAALVAWNALPVKPLGSSLNDFDGDGISNLQEYLMGNALFDPFDPLDIDGDRIPGSIEDASGGILSKLDFADAVRDHDGDGVMNFEEVLLGLNLNGASTSGRIDGFTDAEVLAWGLAAAMPLTPNTDAVRALWEVIDADWLDTNAGGEYYLYWLNEADANNDSVPDGLAAFRADVANFVWQPWSPSVWSIENPSLAYDENWNPIDSDGDGVSDFDRDYDGPPDLWEYRYALKLRDWEDAWEDPDEDGLNNSVEHVIGTNPRLADSDGDGFDDDVEHTQGGDPLDGTVGLPMMLTLVGGSYQSVAAGGASGPLAVKVTQGGQPVQGAEVKFGMSSGGGTLRSTAAATATGAQVTMMTGSDGIASAVYQAGTTEGSAIVTSSLPGSGGQNVGFVLNVVAGVTMPAGGGPVKPWGGQTQSQTGSNGQGEDGMVLEVTAKSYAAGFLNGEVVTPPNTVTYTTGEVYKGSYNLSMLGYYGYPHEVWHLPDDASNSLGDRRAAVYGKFAEQAFGGSVSFSGPPQSLPQLTRGKKVNASSSCAIVKAQGAYERYYETGSAVKVQLKKAPKGSSRSYLILHQRQTYVFSWTNFIQYGELETVGAGSVTFSGAGGGLNVDLAPGTLADGIAKKVGDTLEITPQRPGKETADTITLLPVEVKVVNRDDPTKTWTTGSVTSGPLAYTSPTISEVPDVKNGDLISWSVPGLTSGSFQWWATGPSGSRKDAPSSVTGNEWKLEDPLDWLPGKWRIHCRYTPSSGAAAEFDFEQNLGYRSPDITVIGWIDGAQIILPSGSDIVPSSSYRGYDYATVMDSFVYRNGFLLDVASLTGSSPNWTTPHTPDGGRKYVNAYLIKSSPNEAPPAEFLKEWPGLEGRKTVNEVVLNNFANDKKKFRSFHRFQARFELDDSGKIKGSPHYLKQRTQVGDTPVDWLPDPPGETGPHDGTVNTTGVSIQFNPKNGKTHSAKLADDFEQYTQGRISTSGMMSGGHISKQLNNLKVPWIWSLIEFGVTHAKAGTFAVPEHEIFPVYHVYYNGKRLDTLTNSISEAKLEQFIQLGEPNVP
ncbi:Ig-like domain-containing protein [Prosthecobacter sp.]